MVGCVFIPFRKKKKTTSPNSGNQQEKVTGEFFLVEIVLNETISYQLKQPFIPPGTIKPTSFKRMEIVQQPSLPISKDLEKNIESNW